MGRGNQYEPRLTVQHVPPSDRGHARARKFGRIINISSINGQKGQAGQTNYSAAKAGELGFTKALAQESAKSGITVNAICRGYTATEMVKAIRKDVLEKNILPYILLGRLGEPEEIARCVVFLAADEAGVITGSTLSANIDLAAEFLFCRRIQLMPSRIGGQWSVDLAASFRSRQG
jgi:NAD(P)-dependent dehydrogenase (short-subunit alcohol dehydrogenase family)